MSETHLISNILSLTTAQETTRDVAMSKQEIIGLSLESSGG